jgi:hypothetical protein
MLWLSKSLDEITRLRDLVVGWYDKNWKDKDPETFAYDLSKPGDRLKVFVLGIFFNCIFREDLALEVFKEIEARDAISPNQLPQFESNVNRAISELQRKDGKSRRTLKLQDIVDSVAVTERLFSREGDVARMYKTINDPRKFVAQLYDDLSGMKVKLFWLCREFRHFLQIPEEYCYVPDSHVRKLLWNTGLISGNVKNNPSLNDCFEISKAMSEYLSNCYFDLPFMRFHQNVCKDEPGCSCEMSCRWKALR